MKLLDKNSILLEILLGTKNETPTYATLEIQNEEYIDVSKLLMKK